MDDLAEDAEAEDLLEIFDPLDAEEDEDDEESIEDD